jgi:hypothetical protein
VQREAVGIDLEQGDIGEGVEADDLGRTTLRSENSTKTWSAGRRLPLDSSVTTWALVTISPSALKTKPEPSAAPLPPRRASES